MATLLCMKWRHGRHLDVISSLFTWRTICQISSRSDGNDGAVWFFGRLSSQQEDKTKRDEYSDMGSVPDPKTHGRWSEKSSLHSAYYHWVPPYSALKHSTTAAAESHQQTLLSADRVKAVLELFENNYVVWSVRVLWATYSHSQPSDIYHSGPAVAYSLSIQRVEWEPILYIS